MENKDYRKNKEYFINEKTIYQVLEVNEGSAVCYVMDDFDNRKEAEEFMKECEREAQKE